ncbi:MAG: hypothetical protein OXE02_08370 [Chloroflexi bacterium]|nr:hypothetical protein [Chloroflexota bacterium]
MSHGKTTHPGRIARLDSPQEGHYDRLPAGSVIEDGGLLYLVRRSEAGTGQFSLLRAQCYEDDDGEPYHRPYLSDSHGVIYQPIHPTTRPEDVQGATYAHDDGEFWHFAHCSPHEQRDYAAEAEAFTVAQFAPAIMASNAKGARSDSNAVRNTAYAVSDALLRFSKLCGREAYKEVVSATLGHYHRNPHEDHKRDIALRAIARMQFNWGSATERASDVTRVTTATTEIVTRLRASPAIEWRAERKARLEREAAAKGTDPVAGYEYCYTLSAGVAPTKAIDLPNAAWPFDNLRNGSIMRGAYTYHDAAPATNAFLHTRHRFRRPVPDGTEPGADIGSVAWELDVPS